jgi:hypothetical protein
MPSPRPLIAFVGSVNPEREYKPPLRDTVMAEEACEELGAALAKAGCDLLLFSSKAHYVEATAFRGYAASGVDGRVIVRPPQHATVEFETPPGSSIEVRVEHDSSGEWELPYYRSLLDCDGLVIVGGGQASRVAGLFALLHEVPVLPVAGFGGGAAQVRANLNLLRNDATDDELQLLGRPWTAGLSTELVAVLLAQRERRRERLVEQTRGLARSRWANRSALAITAVALIVSWLAFPFAGTGSAGSTRGLLFLTVVPMIAAVAGALLRNSYRTEPWGWSALSGLAAGFLTVFLYLLGQIASVPDLFEQMNAQRLLLFLAPLGFISGFTFDRVLERVLKGQTKVPPAADVPPV